MNRRERLQNAAHRLGVLLYPRRCPLCDAVLGQNAPFAACCPDCAQEEQRLRHTPPRLPATEHDFYALSGAACAYYYADAVCSAILLCKSAGRPWYAHELADLMAVHLWGAEPALQPGGTPQFCQNPALPPYHVIVPVPPRRKNPGTPSLPRLLAERLSAVLGVPILNPLYTTRVLQPQKTLTRLERLQNTKDAYACRPGADLSGKRVLLVDDVITTGATVSACAKALLEAGAVEVFAAGIAANEELPKEKRKNQEKNKHEATGHRH